MKIALAKGRLGEDALLKFQEIGLLKSVDLNSRKLIFTTKDYELLLLKPSDVIVYVRNGKADLGVVGSDVVMEGNYGVYELLDLKFGICRFSIAAPKDTDVMGKSCLRVATKYPNVTRQYLNEQNIEIIPLQGSVELAPKAGLSDCIVDLVETGKTLQANDLEIIKDLCDVSARLICNPSSYRFLQSELSDLVEALSHD
ncbi:MAG: ATP phosphoribosyltransferase [Clostridia bacterium]|nr:ATP phosphoribosyltransferase [Clostridia bacterium]